MSSSTIVIDFLYLDLEVCQRCQSTEQVLLKALEELTDQFKQEGYEMTLNTINVNSADLAIRHRFVSSPTIRVNQHDIADVLSESTCEDCGTLCGSTVTCRTWIHQGQAYAVPPLALIKEAVLNALKDSSPLEEKPYQLPENLKRYYEGLSHKDKAYPTIHVM